MLAMGIFEAFNTALRAPLSAEPQKLLKHLQRQLTHRFAPTAASSSTFPYPWLRLFRRSSENGKRLREGEVCLFALLSENAQNRSLRRPRIMYGIVRKKRTGNRRWGNPNTRLAPDSQTSWLIFVLELWAGSRKNEWGRQNGSFETVKWGEFVIYLQIPEITFNYGLTGIIDLPHIIECQKGMRIERGVPLCTVP